MAGHQGHDGPPPPSWPSSVVYLEKPRLSPSFPPILIPLICNAKFAPRPTSHPTHFAIKIIKTAGHPAYGQNGLFTKKKIAGGVMLIPYFGVIHASFTPADGDTAAAPDGVIEDPSHEDSDYDLSLLRVSASEANNPFPGWHISIGVDAAGCGNAGRFVNDYRGIGAAPNAEFRVGRGEGGELRMEIWALKSGIGKGDEVLVSYGKGWWGARKG